MPADTTTIDAALKDDYGPAIESQLINEFPLLQLWESVPLENFDGRNAVYPAHLNRNRGVIATGEGGALPTAGNQVLEQVRIPIRYVYGRIQLTGQAIKLSRTNAGSFVRAMRLEMDNLISDLKMQFEFYLGHDGRGVRALLNGDPGTGTTLTLDTPGAVAANGVVTATHGNRFLNVGDNVVAINPASGGVRAGGTRLITAIAQGGATATISAAADAAWATNDYIVRAYGADAAIAIQDTEWLHAPDGLLAAVDDGTYSQVYHGISRSTYPITQSTVIANVNALSLDVLQRGLDVAMQIGGGNIDTLVAHHSVRRAYLTLLESDRRYQGGDLRNPDGGTRAAKGQAVSFGGIPIIVCSQAPYETLWGLDKSTLERYEAVAGEWIDEDGAVLSRVLNQDAFEATYRCFKNFHAVRPNKNVRWDGVDTTIAIAHIV